SIVGSDLPNRLMTIVVTKLKINPGRSSYKSKMPPERKSPQTITVTAPIIIPTKAPFLVTPFQNRDKRIIGPKEAPNPAQAYPTRSKTVLSGFVAISAQWLINLAADAPLTGEAASIYQIWAFSLVFFFYRAIVEGRWNTSLGKWSLG